MSSANKLDHTVINTKYGMDAAADLFAAMGFTLTPRGFHSLGSMNHLMMFGTDYLELLGVPEGGGHQRPDLDVAPVGINGLVFKTDDVDVTYAHMQAIGVDGDPPKTFSRPVDVPEGTRDAKFRTVTVRADVFPGGRVYFCEHGTPELVWRPEWQSHAAGITAVPEFVVASTKADGEAADFARLLNTDVTSGPDGARMVAFDGGRISVLSVDQYGARYGDMASPMNGRGSIFGALVFRTDDLGKLDPLVAGKVDGVVARKSGAGVVARVDAYDSVLEFVG